MSDLRTLVATLTDPPDDPAFRASQLELVRFTGADSAPFALTRAEPGADEVVRYWSRRPKLLGDDTKSLRSSAAAETWFKARVLPRLVNEPATAWIGLTEFGGYMAYPRVTGDSLEMARQVVRGLILTDGSGFEAMLPGEVDAAHVREQALGWAYSEPDEALGDALAESLALVFPETEAFDGLFIRTQRVLVTLSRDGEAPFFPVPTPAAREAAAGYWRTRIVAARGTHKRYDAAREWERARGTLFYEALVPLPRDPAELEARVTSFVLDVLERDYEDVEAAWGVSVAQAYRKMRVELAAPYAMRYPRADFVPLLISVLPVGDAHWDGWLATKYVNGIQRALVSLTGETGAPPVLRDSHRRRASDFWHAWWAERGEDFEMAPQEVGERVMEEWDARTAPSFLWTLGNVHLARAVHTMAIPLLAPLGFGVYVASGEMSKRRSPAGSVLWMIGWVLQMIVWTTVWFLGLGAYLVIRVTGWTLFAFLLAITPWSWPRRWRRWQRARSWR